MKNFLTFYKFDAPVQAWLPKKNFMEPTRPKPKKLGAQHVCEVLGVATKNFVPRAFSWMPQGTGLLLGNSLAVNIYIYFFEK